MNRPSVTAYGAGRMGRGMAICFAYAGYKVTLVDSRARDEQSPAESLVAIPTPFIQQSLLLGTIVSHRTSLTRLLVPT